ncbi:hypothetical protein CONCODRAFT_3896 [Conidiobolus coronatus NRRL 28638]|uniref:Uncharacterized protein n=1 Tax=Conidiobolus coronatus (strain ATCC 28846 / CBS 209.66 / NRRL 28638) TaxID=796925 RepID=A0A137PE32_CONC2|nr:hypothetical protein CONCODRAFT_3896 [Conidiobolus coronatus NRRL 28638]|eukprot:KXN73225.1 hypothetical protein CONCODRAFT_3896 [Conidiobolus coronatus NRRL 28638]
MEHPIIVRDLGEVIFDIHNLGAGNLFQTNKTTLFNELYLNKIKGNVWKVGNYVTYFKVVNKFDFESVEFAIISVDVLAWVACLAMSSNLVALSYR